MKFKGLFLEKMSVFFAFIFFAGNCFASDDILLQEDARTRAFEGYIPSLQFKCAHEILSRDMIARDEEEKNAMKSSIKEALFDVVYAEDIHVHYFFQSALPLIEGVTNGYARSSILRALMGVPVLERPSFVLSVLPFMEGMSDGYGRALLMQDVAKNPLYQDELLMQAVMPLLRGVNNIDERSSIMNALADHPREEVLILSESILPHVKDVIDDCGRATVVKILCRNKSILKSSERVASVMAKMRSQYTHWFRM